LGSVARDAYKLKLRIKTINYNFINDLNFKLYSEYDKRNCELCIAQMDEQTR